MAERKPFQVWAVWGAHTPNQRGVMVSDHDTLAEAQLARHEAVVEDTGMFDNDAERGEFGEFMVLTNRSLTAQQLFGVG